MPPHTNIGIRFQPTIVPYVKSVYGRLSADALLDRCKLKVRIMQTNY